MSLSRALPPFRPALPADGLSVHSPKLRELPVRMKLFPGRPQRIGVIGNHWPRQCGIATFTTDLCDALQDTYSSTELLAVPVTDADFSYEYPERVQFEVMEDDTVSYQRAKDFLNLRRPDVVCLQHEYGIFGGSAGSNILHLLRGLRMPIITTLHTVLREPNSEQRRVMEEITELSARLVVMSAHSSELLQSVFSVPAEKIDVIHHGVPDLPFKDSTDCKKALGLDGKTVLLSFGLLSPNKGIENIIAALPEIVLHNPAALLLIVGATHPHLMRREGDSYKRSLEDMARKLGVQDHVRFHHEFVSPSDMARFIGAADVYITPYRHEAQASSGTLAYAMGAGKAIISTPYWHAAELLAEGRGMLVPFNSPSAIAEKTNQLFQNPSLAHSIRQKAYQYGRTMIWKSVATQYMTSFQKARGERSIPNSHVVTIPKLCEAQAS
jgi:glycosyltransferase involved in cell wall biosynthesis